MRDTAKEAARLSHIALESENPARMVDFYRDVMMNQSTELDDNMWLLEGPDRRVLICAGANKRLRFGAYQFDHREGLDALRKRLVKAGCPVTTSQSPLFGDEAFTVVDPDGNRLVFGLAEDIAPTGTVDGLDGRLQHLVVATDDIQPMISFYSDVVGMTISDRVLDESGELTACFLRSDQEHHSFAVFRAPEKRLDHHCYEAGSWNAIRDWADRAVANDVEIQWGPGRHGAGNNLFIFVHDPDGNWLEVSAELETKEFGAEPGVWAHEPKTLNLWGHAKMRS